MTDLIDEAAAKQAVATVTAYPAKIHAAATACARVPLGPWRMSVSCNFSCGKSFKASMAIDFSGARADLQSTLTTAEDYARTFTSQWEFVNLWMAQTLPQLADDFGTAQAAVAQAEQELQKNGTVTPATKKAVDDGLDALMKVLGSSQQELSKGEAALAAWDQQLTGYEQAIGTARSNLTGAATSSLAQVKNGIASYPCGQKDALRQFDNFKAQFTAAVGSFGSIFGQLGADSKNAHNAISVLLGTVTNFISKYQPVVRGVKTAQGAQLGSFLQQFQLDIASKAWNGLVAYAREQLGVGQAALAAALVDAGVEQTAASRYAVRLFSTAA